MNQERSYGKVFCLGWLKTGTSSLGEAMRRLGFRHASWDPKVWGWYRNGEFERIIEHAAGFDSFDDLPWNRVELLERLDLSFPNSKFVLLERGARSWFRSSRAHNLRLGQAARGELGAILWFWRRNRTIRRYFRGRPDSLLVMNLAKGDGYDLLCPFLELPVPNQPFPHINKSAER